MKHETAWPVSPRCLFSACFLTNVFINKSNTVGKELRRLPQNNLLHGPVSGRRAPLCKTRRGVPHCEAKRQVNLQKVPQAREQRDTPARLQSHPASRGASSKWPRTAPEMSASPCPIPNLLTQTHANCVQSIKQYLINPRMLNDVLHKRRL